MPATRSTKRPTRRPATASKRSGKPALSPAAARFAAALAAKREAEDAAKVEKEVRIYGDVVGDDVFIRAIGPQNHVLGTWVVPFEFMPGNTAEVLRKRFVRRNPFSLDSTYWRGYRVGNLGNPKNGGKR